MAAADQRQGDQNNEGIDLGAGIGDNALDDNASVAESFSTAQVNFVNNAPGTSLRMDG